MLDTVTGAAAGGARIWPAPTSDPDAHFTDLGGDSLSALTFSNLLQEIFGVEVPVGVIISPASDLRQLADYIETERQSGSTRPTFATVHGQGATTVYASDLTLDKFIDAATLAAAQTLPRVAGRAADRSAHRRQRLPRPFPDAGMAGTAVPHRRQADHHHPRRRRRARPGSGWRRSSTAETRSCSVTSASWPPSTSRSSPATSASRTSAWTRRPGSGWPRVSI